MSDPVEQVDLEDVLASVRRLVSARPESGPDTRPAPRGADAPGRLVLTSDLRIADPAPAPAPAAEPAAAAPEGAGQAAAQRVQTLEDRIAELEAAVNAQAAEFEPDGSEDTEQHRPRAILRRDPLPAAQPAAPEPAGTAAEDEALHPAEPRSDQPAADIGGERPWRFSTEADTFSFAPRTPVDRAPSEDEAGLRDAMDEIGRIMGQGDRLAGAPDSDTDTDAAPDSDAPRATFSTRRLRPLTLGPASAVPSDTDAAPAAAPPAEDPGEGMDAPGGLLAEGSGPEEDWEDMDALGLARLPGEEEDEPDAAEAMAGRVEDLLPEALLRALAEAPEAPQSPPTPAPETAEATEPGEDEAADHPGAFRPALRETGPVMGAAPRPVEDAPDLAAMLERAEPRRPHLRAVETAPEPEPGSGPEPRRPSWAERLEAADFAGAEALDEASVTAPEAGEPAAAPAAQPGAHAASEAEDQVIDEDALREMVAEIVRRELQGALGERITRNVRKLVRREIMRAISIRDFE